MITEQIMLMYNLGDETLVFLRMPFIPNKHGEAPPRAMPEKLEHSQ
jgi:hypothetical protein